MGDTSPASTWPDLLTLLIGGTDLSLDQARWAMGEIMSGEAAPSVVGAFLVALRAKGESVAELRGLADVMLEHAHRIEVSGPSMDVVGTGGDRLHTVNISTMSAIVVAAAGVRIVKHGNRAASSSSGSADVLEALGVSLALTPEQVARVGERAGITFCFAQSFHPSMRHAAPVRRDLGIGTAFNVLGPLTNPGQPSYAAVGVADPRIAPLVAGVFAERGRPAAVFRGDDGLDELTLATTSTLWWVAGGSVHRHTVSPEEIGVGRAPIEALRGADAQHNAGVARDVLAGAAGPVRDAVLLNAGAALAVSADSASGADREEVLDAIRLGVARAATAIDEGAASEVLDRWVRVSAEVGAGR